MSTALQFRPPPGVSRDWRTPYFRKMWAFGLVVAVLFLGLNLVEGRLWAAAVLLGLATAGAASLAWEAAVRDVTWPGRVSLVCLTLSLSVLGLLQSPPNTLAPLYLILVPMLSGYLFSWPETRFWLLLTLLVGGAAEGAMAAGWYLHGEVRAWPPLVAMANYVAVVLAVVLYARWFQLTREELYRDLQRALNARTTLLANVSHEIRTPMNGVLGLTELLLDDNPTAAQRERLELIRQSGRSLVSLLDDLLDLARLERVGMELKPETVRVDALVAGVGRLFLPVAQQKGLSLRVEVPPLQTRLADPLRLRQVLSNLVSNAVKFTERGSVYVRVQAQGEEVSFEVEDTGVGVPADVVPRLFQPFERGEAGQGRRFQGTGLGLALARELVQRMGGGLTLTSAPGRGSCFRFSLRLPEVPDDAPQVAGVTGPVGRLAGAPGAFPVLVVDDDFISLKVASGLVAKAGFVVRQATSGQEALEAAAQERLGLVLMDCEMPGMDGFEATRQLLRRHGTQAPPVVALTASAEPERVRACLEAGMAQVLVKPLSYPLLLDVLDTLASGAPTPPRGTTLSPPLSGRPMP